LGKELEKKGVVALPKCAEFLMDIGIKCIELLLEGAVRGVGLGGEECWYAG